METFLQNIFLCILMSASTGNLSSTSSLANHISSRSMVNLVGCALFFKGIHQYMLSSSRYPTEAHDTLINKFTYHADVPSFSQGATCTFKHFSFCNSMDLLSSIFCIVACFLCRFALVFSAALLLHAHLEISVIAFTTCGLVFFEPFLLNRTSNVFEMSH